MNEFYRGRAGIKMVQATIYVKFISDRRLNSTHYDIYQYRQSVGKNLYLRLRAYPMYTLPAPQTIQVCFLQQYQFITQANYLPRFAINILLLSTM